MGKLKNEHRIDLHLPAAQADVCFSTDYLFGPARGKMFGVLVAEAPGGGQVTLRAFSGQYNGIWKVPGWVGPIFDLNAFHRVHDDEERRIKALGSQINVLQSGSPARAELIALRNNRSRQLMADIHRLYRLHNFCGRTAGLQDIFLPGTGIPTGTGDCCAPKLLHHAAVHDLRPLGMAEFYWGRTTVSGSRQHGWFYAPCRTRCLPILGFLLCGLEKGSSCADG
jgi:hypothetical protein